MRLLFVCTGNICRSPTAEGVMRSVVAEAGLDREIEVDSAGTGSWHVGQSVDPRARAAAALRGIELDGVARRVRPEDLDEFDLLLAADHSHLLDLLALAGEDQARRRRVHLLREFDPAAESGDLEIPDPYYGGRDGFEHVLDLCEAACRGLLAQLETESRL
jgi:protein-tyrosine phosphatase